MLRAVSDERGESKSPSLAARRLWHFSKKSCADFFRQLRGEQKQITSLQPMSHKNAIASSQSKWGVFGGAILWQARQAAIHHLLLVEANPKPPVQNPNGISYPRSPRAALSAPLADAHGNLTLTAITEKNPCVNFYLIGFCTIIFCCAAHHQVRNF